MMRRTVAILSLVMLLVGLVYVPMNAEAANEFYGDYTDAAKVYDYGSCPSMQGLAVGSQMLYTVKIGSNDTQAFISMTDKDSGTTTKLYNSDAGSYYFNYLGHANDMDVWGIDGNSHIFVATTNTGSNAIVRLKRVGNTLTKVASYRLTCEGSDICATAMAIKSVSNGKITFITKWGMQLYTGSVSTSATSATIEMTKLCSISKSRVYIKGSYLDLSDFVNQGFGYYQDHLFVPITGDDSQLNRSVIMVFDLRNASGTIYPSEALVFRVTSGAYSALFEIESCDICSGDGKLYFNTNRRKTNSDTNHDGVSSIHGYTFSKLPVDAPTSVPKFTMRYNANGGTGSMADTVVTYGVSTALRSNTFTRTGYTFAGWTAYRTAKGQWRYVSADGSIDGWYAEGSQPAGCTKYIYKNGTKVSATTNVAGDVVQLYAQWTPASYTVTFKDEDGTVLKTGTVAHGATPTAPANPTKASDGTYSYTFAGWSPAIKAATGNATYTATYTAKALTPAPTEPAPTEPAAPVAGTVAPYLERVDSAAGLEEGVPYVISDYKDTWLHYVLTSEKAQKVAGSKTHTGYLLSGTPSADVADLWYIKDGKLVYGSADSNRYLLISYDSASQGVVELGNYDAAKAAYVSYYSDDNFAIRSTTHYLNRHGGTANDFIATAYSSAGGSYWHLDRLVTGKVATMTLSASAKTVSVGGSAQLTPVVKVDGVAAGTYTVAWNIGDSSVATISTKGIVTALKPGQVTVTAILTAVDGHQLISPITASVTLTTDGTSVSASVVQDAAVTTVDSPETGVPYVITEYTSGYALTDTMLYTSSTGYKGLSGTQGLKLDTYDLNNAPVWYYDGSHLLYGSANGGNNYLVVNSAGQVALGSASEKNIFDTVVLYSSSSRTYNIYPSALKATSSKYYLNQLGGKAYNVVSLWSGASTSRWCFHEYQPQRTVALSFASANGVLDKGASLTLTPSVTVDGNATKNYALTWATSDASVATVSNGKVTGVGAGKAVITVTLSSADGRALDTALTVKINVEVIQDLGYTAEATQEAKLVKVTSLQKGVPYVITEKNTGVALTGEMLYTTDSGYKGLSGTQGLKLTAGVTAENAPVWYYDGSHLLYGSAKASNNYLVFNSAGQIALGSASEKYIFDNVSLYSSSNKTFLLYSSAKTSGSTKYYLNQYGGGGYNVAYLWHSASTSQWHFSQLIEQKNVSLNVTPSLTQLSKGKTANLTATVTVNGTEVSDYTLTWTTSNASVATVSNGAVTAVANGTAVLTATLTAAEGDTFAEPVVITIPLTVG
jgi:uncharacterized protein YjdB